MRISTSLIAGALLVSSVSAAPSQLQFQDASQSNAFAFSSPASSVFGWVHSAVEQLTSTKEQVHEAVSDFAITRDDQYASLDRPDYSDKTIWEVIQEEDLLSDLRHVLKYSGKSTRELLDDKSKKLTFLIPINWRNKRHDDKELSEFNMGHWNAIDAQINDLETTSSNDDDDDKKRRKRKAIEYLIDSTIHYHVIHSHGEPLKAYDVAQNSSVATDFSIGNGRAREVVGNLFDGENFRLRVGKSLLPRPSVYFNFYSRLVYPDVNVGGSSVHAISLPLLLPPSALQTLYFSSPDLAATTVALQKTHMSIYLGYPINRSAIHDHHDEFAAALGPISARRHEGSGNHKHSHDHPEPQTALTFFVPSNIAWYRLPPLLRLFLQSPFGYGILGKVLGLHAIPYTIFYADFLHTSDKRFELASQETIPAAKMVASTEWLWGTSSDAPSMPLSNVNVTRYTFETACPKLHFNRTEEASSGEKPEFEKVDVAVYRYKILPGGRGPLQTRVSVQGVPVTFQDIATGNGALHVIDRFIKPKGYHPKDPSSGGIWSIAAAEAEKYGFGSVDLTNESF